jgi:hypothetical protein
MKRWGCGMWDVGPGHDRARYALFFISHFFRRVTLKLVEDRRKKIDDGQTITITRHENVSS